VPDAVGVTAVCTWGDVACAAGRGGDGGRGGRMTRRRARARVVWWCGCASGVRSVRAARRQRLAVARAVATTSGAGVTDAGAVRRRGWRSSAGRVGSRPTRAALRVGAATGREQTELDTTRWLWGAPVSHRHSHKSAKKKSRQPLLWAHHDSSHSPTRLSKGNEHPRRTVPAARRLWRQRTTASADTPATTHMPPSRGDGRAATHPRHGDGRSASPRPTRGHRANVGRCTRRRLAGSAAAGATGATPPLTCGRWSSPGPPRCWHARGCRREGGSGRGQRGERRARASSDGRSVLTLAARRTHPCHTQGGRMD